MTLMKQITYKDTKNLPEDAVHALFLSVNWDSANYPKRLVKAFGNCGTVITAWCGDRLVGLVSAIDDGEMTAYIHYLLVDPDYQGLGIGKELIKRVTRKYEAYLYTIIIAETKKLTGFYKKLGFSQDAQHNAMHIMNRSNQL